MTANLPSFPARPFPAFPPLWAEVFGEDDFGIFAEFAMEGARFVWRWIPPGRFLMGSPEDEPGRFSDEGPQHTVMLTRGFWMGETPVTQAQWRALMEENPSNFRGDDRPVEQITWRDCMTFAQRLNETVSGLHATLPTEAQWEYACRAGTGSAFNDGSPCTKPEGNDAALDPLGWYDMNSGGQTHEVRQKRPNAWGLHDMHGNVLEWCRDDQRAYTQDPQRDPMGPMEEGANHVERGGSWDDQARNCRAAVRFQYHPVVRGYDLGVRLAAGQEPGPAEPLSAERALDRKGGSRG